MVEKLHFLVRVYLQLQEIMVFNHPELVIGDAWEAEAIVQEGLEQVQFVREDGAIGFRYRVASDPGALQLKFKFRVCLFCCYAPKYPLILTPSSTQYKQGLRRWSLLRFSITY